LARQLPSGHRTVVLYSVPLQVAPDVPRCGSGQLVLELRHEPSQQRTLEALQKALVEHSEDAGAQLPSGQRISPAPTLQPYVPVDGSTDGTWQSKSDQAHVPSSQRTNPSRLHSVALAHWLCKTAQLPSGQR
jgi:hypothetical protein